MLNLSAKIREKIGKKMNDLRDQDIIPAVLYGPKVKNLNLEVDLRSFDKIFKEAGESSLIKIQVEGNKDYEVLIHDMQRDALKGTPIHVDFYMPSQGKEIIVKVPIAIEGDSPAVKEFGGTLVRDIHEIEIKGLIRDLPKEIKVDISGLKAFSDRIKVKDLVLPPGVKILKEQDEIIVSVAEPENVEEELAKPFEEKVEEIEVVKKEKKGAEELKAEAEKPAKTEKTS